MVRDCDTALYAASAKERATACSSTVARPRCNSKVRSDGNPAPSAEPSIFPLSVWPLSAVRCCVLIAGPFSFWRGVASMELSLVADCSPTVP